MTTTHRCVICPVYGNDGLEGRAEPRHWEHPHACWPCRDRFRAHLTDISTQWPLLDATPGQGSSERVTGTREAPLGVRVDVLDQQVRLTPRGHDRITREGALTISDNTYRTLEDGELSVNDNKNRDQIGAPPAVVILDMIAAEWLQDRRSRGRHERRPVPTVPNLAAWLCDRVDSACEHLPDAIGDNASEIRQLVGRLHGLTGDTKSRPEHLAGVPCPNCDMIALIRYPGADHVGCSKCSHVGTREEYERWTGLLAAHLKEAA